MKIILYNSSAEKNRVDKGGHLSQIAEVTNVEKAIATNKNWVLA